MLHVGFPVADTVGRDSADWGGTHDIQDHHRAYTGMRSLVAGIRAGHETVRGHGRLPARRRSHLAPKNGHSPIGDGSHSWVARHPHAFQVC